MKSADGKNDSIKGKLRQTTGKIINQKLEIASNLIDRKLEIMDGFMRRKERNKAKIRLAAQELFNKYGIDRVSINDISTKARVSQVTIYNLFGSKDKLVIDWVADFGGKFIDQLRQLSTADKPYYARVEDVIQMMVGVTESNPALANEDIQHMPEMKQVEDALLEQIRNLFMDFIHAGQKEGYLNPDISDDATAAYTEILVRGMNANPEIHARTHHDIKLFHDLILIMLFGFSRPNDVGKAKFSIRDEAGSA